MFINYRNKNCVNHQRMYKKYLWIIISLKKYLSRDTIPLKQDIWTDSTSIPLLPIINVLCAKNKQLIETNKMIVSFNEMHGFFCKFQAIVSAEQCQ